jgi:AcrR family transcriptional regulator
MKFGKKTTENLEMISSHKKKERKTDRRSLMTCAMIRDALLKLLKSTSYSKITVAPLCRQAGITRATFYQHYENIDAVVDELLDEALRITELDDVYNQNMEHIPMDRKKSDRNTEKSSSEVTDPDIFLPACQRAASDSRYRPLFLDEDLSPLILNKLYNREHDRQTERIRNLYHINQKDADMIFLYQLNGSFAVNRALGWEKGPDWYHTQEMIRHFWGPGRSAS